MSRFTRKLIGMTVEKSTKNLIAETYHGCFLSLSIRPSRTKITDIENVIRHKILVSELISNSKRPTFDRDLEVDNACLVSAPVYITRQYTVAFEAITVLAQAEFSTVRGRLDFALLFLKVSLLLGSAES